MKSGVVTYEWHFVSMLMNGTECSYQNYEPAKHLNMETMKMVNLLMMLFQFNLRIALDSSEKHFLLILWIIYQSFELLILIMWYSDTTFAFSKNIVVKYFVWKSKYYFVYILLPFLQLISHSELVSLGDKHIQCYKIII
jgi:hypothetical protein